MRGAAVVEFAGGVGPARVADGVLEDAAIAFAELRHELHELSQPLTRLQWRLEIGQRVGDEATLRQAVEGGLGDLRELMEHVRRLRTQLAHCEAWDARDAREAMEVRR